MDVRTQITYRHEDPLHPRYVEVHQHPSTELSNKSDPEGRHGTEYTTEKQTGWGTSAE